MAQKKKNQFTQNGIKYGKLLAKCIEHEREKMQYSMYNKNIHYDNLNYIQRTILKMNQRKHYLQVHAQNSVKTNAATKKEAGELRRFPEQVTPSNTY